MTHHAAFHQPGNISSAAFHFSRYHATERNDTGCIATGYHAAPNHANLDTATENRLGRLLGGVAYDHGDFPKIISVHSMAERYQESNTSEATADCHCNPHAEAKNVFEDVTDVEKPTNHSISTILDLSSSSPVQNFGRIKPLSEVCSLRNNARKSLDSDENEFGKQSECISTEDESVKVSWVCPCSNLDWRLSLPFLPRQGKERRKSLGSRLASLPRFLGFYACDVTAAMLAMTSEQRQRFSNEFFFFVSWISRDWSLRNQSKAMMKLVLSIANSSSMSQLSHQHKFVPWSFPEGLRPSFLPCHLFIDHECECFMRAWLVRASPGFYTSSETVPDVRNLSVRKQKLRWVSFLSLVPDCSIVFCLFHVLDPAERRSHTPIDRTAAFVRKSWTLIHGVRGSWYLIR